MKYVYKLRYEILVKGTTGAVLGYSVGSHIIPWYVAFPLAFLIGLL